MPPGTLAEQHMDKQPTIGLIAPYNACYLVLTIVQKYMGEHSQISDSIHKALNSAGLSYIGIVRLRHPIDVLVYDYGLYSLSSKVKFPLDKTKIACYYGCQMVRPYSTIDDQTNPTSVDQLMQALGAHMADWDINT